MSALCVRNYAFRLGCASPTSHQMMWLITNHIKIRGPYIWINTQTTTTSFFRLRSIAVTSFPKKLELKSSFEHTYMADMLK